MSDGAAIAIGVGVVAVAYLFIRSQEQKTAVLIQQQQKQHAAQTGASGPYALSINDQFAIGATILATYFGGPGAGAKTAGALAS